MHRMQIRVYPELAKQIRVIRKERLKIHGRRDSCAEISNELIRRALMMQTLPIK